MARIWAVPALALALTACASRTGGPEQLQAEIVTFEPDGDAPGKYATLSTDSIDVQAFASWYASADLGSDNEPITATPGTTLVAATDMTGCRTPESVEVRRVGDDLQVKFTGGTDHEECLRAVGPSAVLKLQTNDVQDVRTINGERPVDPAGPAKLEHFVNLGTENYDNLPPAELGNTEEMAAHLSNHPDAQTALNTPIPANHRGFAFIQSGCAETSTVLLITHDTLTPKLTGGNQTTCDQQTYFLTTFTIPEDNVPPNATPK